MVNPTDSGIYEVGYELTNLLGRRPTGGGLKLSRTGEVLHSRIVDCELGPSLWFRTDRNRDDSLPKPFLSVGWHVRAR